MKGALTILFSTFTLFCVGQIATLDIRNPAPRISDGVDVSVSFEKKRIKRNEVSMSADEFRRSSENQLGTGEMNFRTELLDTGLVTIGPFKFTVNKTDFTTDEITIRVFPDLPNVNDGIWLRVMTFRGEDILLLEQRISHDWKKENGHTSMSADSEGVNFSSLDIYKVYDLGIELKEMGSFTSSRGTRDYILGSGVVSYKWTKYKITKRDTFKNKVLITKNLFINFPLGIDILQIEIE